MQAFYAEAVSISKQNVDLVLAAYSRFNAGARIPGRVFWHENAEYETTLEDPESTIHRGIGAIRRQFDRWHEVYPDLCVEIQAVKTNGDYVFLWVRQTGQGAASGGPYRHADGARLHHA
jgi:hypothetical protein